jgi:hypothetical protein
LWMIILIYPNAYQLNEARIRDEGCLFV